MGDQITIVYRLAENYCRETFVATGTRPDSEPLIRLDATALSPAARAGLLVTRQGSRPAGTGSREYVAVYVLPGDISIDHSYHQEPAIQVAELVAGRPLFTDEVDDILAGYPPRLAAIQAELDAAIAAYRAEAAEKAAAKRAEDAAFSAAQAETKRREAAEKAAAAAERAAWIAEHGSAYLQKAVGADYNCQRRYVTERAALELPGFSVDFDDRAEWKLRSCPSEAALDACLTLREAGYAADVVWLTREIDDPDYLEPREREAVVVRGYLGRYDAVR